MDMKDIRARYQKLICLHAIPYGALLKADAYNEAEDEAALDWGCVSQCASQVTVTFLELDPDVVARAREKHPGWDIRQGDIRAVPFERDTFSTVVDLSTLDHVPPGDVARVIHEYARVLQYWGRLILVAWCSEKEIEGEIGWPGHQYVVHEESLMRALQQARLRVFHKKKLVESGDIYLLEVIADRRG